MTSSLLFCSLSFRVSFSKFPDFLSIFLPIVDTTLFHCDMSIIKNNMFFYRLLNADVPLITHKTGFCWRPKTGVVVCVFAHESFIDSFFFFIQMFVFSSFLSGCATAQCELQWRKELLSLINLSTTSTKIGNKKSILQVAA